MKRFNLWIILLALWNVVLFYNNSFGISVSLFIIPLLVYLYKLLKDNNKIKNKKGLLLVIPIILLSFTYFIFNNSFFKSMNFLVIIGLIDLMYIITIKNTFKFDVIINDIFANVFKPFAYIGKFFSSLFPKKEKRLFKKSMSNQTRRVIKSILVSLPIIIIILLLLSSADMIFGKIFSEFFSIFKININFDVFYELYERSLLFIFILILLGTSGLYIKEYGSEIQIKESNDEKKKDLLTLKIIFISLNVIYVLFDFIQIKSLMLHSISMSGITYAEYARQGFFQLMFVSIINLSLILFSKKFENKSNLKEFNTIKISSLIMIFLTIIIIISSYLRMNLYEQAYGYTVLRLLVYISLITEFILMIPTIIYIFNNKYPIVKSYIIILISVYVITNYMNIDYIIANKNISRYYNNYKIDLDYLMNYNSDNIPSLVDLYSNMNNSDEKNRLNDYLYDMKNDWLNTNIFEYNISKKKALKYLNKIKLETPDYMLDYYNE